MANTERHLRDRKDKMEVLKVKERYWSKTIWREKFQEFSQIIEDLNEEIQDVHWLPCKVKKMKIKNPHLKIREWSYRKLKIKKIHRIGCIQKNDFQRNGG